MGSRSSTVLDDVALAVLRAATLAILLWQAACRKDEGTPAGPPPEPSLSVLTGTCAVEKFEFWSTDYPVPPAVRLLYDAAANGYVATLRISATSRTSGTYALSATSRDPLRLGDVASGSLSLVEPDSLRFSGAVSLPGTTHFDVASSQLTLVNPHPRQVTMPPIPRQATTRIVCRW